MISEQISEVPTHENEREFLRWLLARERLGGYDTVLLTEWFDYAKQLFRDWPSRKPALFALKILDELGQLIFGACRVTARLKDEEDGSEKWRLLTPPETALIEAWLPETEPAGNLIEGAADQSKYNRERANLDARLDNLTEKIKDPGKRVEVLDAYREHLDCRIAFTRLGKAALFHWKAVGKRVVILFEETPAHSAEDIEAARQFLAGFAQVALASIDRAPAPSVKRPNYQKPFGVLDANVELACRLVPEFHFRWMMRCERKKRPYGEFDLLFLCKDTRGWFWAFTREQRKILAERQKSAPLSPSFDLALEHFRLEETGIVKHLERTQRLIEYVHNPQEEKFTCVEGGYRLEKTAEYAGTFQEIEKFPGLDAHDYFYLRLSSHFDASQADWFEQPTSLAGQPLPVGSLVAVFSIPRPGIMDKGMRADFSVIWRGLVEVWRNQAAAIRPVHNAVTEQEKEKREAIQKQARLTARAALMSRNLSHNVGSHALANPRLAAAVGIDGTTACNLEESRQRLATFHSYTQGRLDFMARAISPSRNRPEPLLFIGDVLNGFFRQGVLLHTLIEDAGFSADRIQFRVQIQDKEWAEGQDKSKRFGTTIYKVDRAGEDLRLAPREFTAVEDNNCPAKDVLVGVPGGVTGAHALYSFLENVMRNAVKYGHKLQSAAESEKPAELCITLRLENCHAESGSEEVQLKLGWLLTILDNVSTDAKGVCREIRRHIQRPLVGDPTAESSGHGIQEMKVCAEELAGGLGFRTDSALRALGCQVSCLGCAEYRHYLKGEGAGDNEERLPLRCFTRGEEEQLAYSLFLPAPLLLAVCDTSRQTAERGTNLTPEYVLLTPVLKGKDGLAESGAHLAIILDREDQEGMAPEAILNLIAGVHYAMPCRLLILCRDESRRKLWAHARAEREGPVAAKSAANAWKDRLPKRRVFEHADEKLWDALSRQDLSHTFLGLSGFEAMVMHAYDCWLRAFKDRAKGQNDPWLLCIGFDHGGEARLQKWAGLLDRFDERSCIAALIVSKDGGSGDTGNPRVVTPNWPLGSGAGWRQDLKVALEAECAAETVDKRFLVFDNHGKIFPGIGLQEVPRKGSSRFYQRFGLKDSLNLFQTLDCLPSGRFPFTFLIYALVEASLTTVAIIDERFAQASIDPKEGMLNRGERDFQKAGLFPLYTVRREYSREWKFQFISRGIQELKEKTAQFRAENDIPGGKAREDWNRFWSDEAEGLCLSDLGSVLGISDSGGGEPVVTTDTIDAIVLHEGVTDILEKPALWNGKGEDVWKLYESAPVVVRTSGRGRQSRHVGDHFAFMEFTELSENTYVSLNKLAIARAILGSAGTIMGDA